MVRTVLWLVGGIISLFVTSVSAFAQDAMPLAVRLGLQTSNPAACHTLLNTSFTDTSVFSSQTRQCGTPSNQTSLTRFNFALKREPFNLQNVRDMPSLLDQGGSRLFEASNNIPLVHEALTAGVQMVYRDPFLTSNSANSSTNQMGAQFFLKGTIENMKYRAEYGYAGQETGNALSLAPSDQIGGKFLWEWNLPLITPRVEFSRFANNIDKDPTRSQTISTQQRFSLDWNIPDWPTLTLAYAREQKDIFASPQGQRTNATFTETTSANLSFKNSWGTSNWSSHYKSSTNKFEDNSTSYEIGSSVGGTLKLFDPVDMTSKWGFTRQADSSQNPLHNRYFTNLGTIFQISPTLTLKPGIEFTRHVNLVDTLRTDTLSAKLGYIHNLNQSYRISMFGKYILNQTSYQTSNPQTYDVSLLVQKDIRDIFNLAHSQQLVSLKIAHNQQVNSLYTSTQSSHSTAMLLVSIIP